MTKLYQYLPVTIADFTFLSGYFTLIQ